MLENMRQTAHHNAIEIPPLPLSFAQQSLSFLELNGPRASKRNLPSVLRIIGDLNVEALHRALSSIVGRDDSLHTGLGGKAKSPIPIRPELPMPVVDLRAIPQTERDAEAQWLISRETQRPFDLLNGPLFRAVLLRAEQEEHILLVVVQHLVGERWSPSLICRDLAVLYEAFTHP